jgi:hypothetical protein
MTVEASAISNPTTERMLEAFKGINLLIGRDGQRQLPD